MESYPSEIIFIKPGYEIKYTLILQRAKSVILIKTHPDTALHTRLFTVSKFTQKAVKFIFRWL